MISKRSPNDVLPGGDRECVATRPRFDQSGTVLDGIVLRENRFCAILSKPPKGSRMTISSCMFVGVNDDLRAIAHAAARLVYPDAEITSANSLDEALQREMRSGELLVLGAARNDELARAAAEKDATGFPRWPIVRLGASGTYDGVEFVPPEEIEVRVLARAFCAVVERHQLALENARLRGDLLAVAYRISHDLRTPLGGILSAGEVVKECLADAVPDQVALATPLFDSAEELGSLIERVSFVLKASAKAAPKQHTAIGDIVWAALQRVELQAVRTNALLIQPDAWPEADCVPTWTEIAFTNLIANGLQHGGTPPRVELSWQQTSSQFRFCVRDNGKGVREEIRTTLFQPFHSLHQLNGSRGLGLSITQRLIELQGGDCGYEPLADGGSRFFFTLPTTDERPAKSGGPKAKGL
jgi:signal transduction histidine kinase